MHDRRTNLSYSQHVSLVYTPVPPRRRSRWCTRQPVAMEEDEIHEEGFLEISQHLQMLQQGEEKFGAEQYEKAAAGGGGFEGGFENPIEDIFGSLMTVLAE
ncbi:uncharacterized protein [Triticum aestivum]|uniref:uncharacterized protein isoform X2 n=1 Tax=Triticum aestivum TaxID=4565 RepID=UPI000E7A5310|nr:uncharacterized protein LOC123113802 isoform X2 [Triticum aestivum]